MKTKKELVEELEKALLEALSNPRLQTTAVLLSRVLEQIKSEMTEDEDDPLK
jgi:hypothetical protein